MIAYSFLSKLLLPKMILRIQAYKDSCHQAVHKGSFIPIQPFVTVEKLPFTKKSIYFLPSTKSIFQYFQWIKRELALFLGSNLLEDTTLSFDVCSWYTNCIPWAIWTV